jgi:hypothetical protein
MDKNFWDFKNLEKQQGVFIEDQEEGSGNKVGMDILEL